MTNSKLLRTIIDDRGLKLKKVAEMLNLSCYGLSLKINNKNEFKTGEIVKLCNLLGIDNLEEREAIFFSQEVD